MKYTTLGKTGLKISRMGFGGIPIQRIDAEGTKKLMKQLAEEGVNYIDTARGYTVSEEYLGYALEVLLMTCEGLDSMDTVERKKLSYRIQVYLEDITHNGSFFYYNSDFVLVANALSEEYLCRLVEGAIKRGKRRMPGLQLCVGIGSRCMDISQLSVSYQRAKAAALIAMTQKKQVVKFDDCGLFRLLYMVEDKEILKEMETECLAALEEYDRRYHAGYVETLQSYLKHNGSIQAVAAELYTHRNTVLYRIGNIRKILGNELKTPEERLPYQIAFYIRNMHGQI